MTLMLSEKKELTWVFKVAVDLVVRRKCSRQFARDVKRNAKSLLDPAETVRFTAKSVSQNAKKKSKLP